MATKLIMGNLCFSLLFNLRQSFGRPIALRNDWWGFFRCSAVLGDGSFFECFLSRYFAIRKAMGFRHPKCFSSKMESFDGGDAMNNIDIECLRRCRFPRIFWRVIHFPLRYRDLLRDAPPPSPLITSTTASPSPVISP